MRRLDPSFRVRDPGLYAGRSFRIVYEASAGLRYRMA
jgi:hypothetical protein